MPDRVEVSIDETSAAKLHERALQRWQKSFRPDELRALTGQLEIEPEGYDAHVLEQLKAVRKDGAILRAAYQSLDEMHAPPRVLDHFIAVFGKLNDAVENKVPAEVQKQARRLGKLLDAERVGKLDAALASFRPTSKASFDHFIDRSLTEVETVVAADALPAERFHDVRKSLKDVLAVVHLLEDGPDETKQSHATYKHLFALNEKIGHMHDELVRKDLKGKTDYDGARIEVPKVLRQSIRDLRARFRNVPR